MTPPAPPRTTGTPSPALDASAPGAGRRGPVYDVVIYSGYMAFDGATLSESSLGGSETATIQVARHLAALGHHVVVFSPCPERQYPNGERRRGGMFDGVIYQPIELYDAYVQGTPHDVTIIAREFSKLGVKALSRLTLFWCHDLARKLYRPHVQGALWLLDGGIYTVSEWMAEQYRTVYGIPKEAVRPTRNGVDLGAIRGATQKVTRERFALCYGSRPERGLETVCRVMEAIHARGRTEVKCRVSWYDNTHPDLAGMYDALFRRASSTPGIEVLGPKRQDEWHRVLAGSDAMIYPGCAGEFREVSCIAAIEAMACGTPVVAVNKGALGETLSGVGVMVGDETSDVHSDAYLDAFVSATLATLDDLDAWRARSLAGIQRAAGYSWAGVASDWTARWAAVLETPADPRSIRRELRRIGEREALPFVEAALLDAGAFVPEPTIDLGSTLAPDGDSVQ